MFSCHHLLSFLSLSLSLCLSNITSTHQKMKQLGKLFNSFIAPQDAWFVFRSCWSPHFRFPWISCPSFAFLFLFLFHQNLILRRLVRVCLLCSSVFSFPLSLSTICSSVFFLFEIRHTHPNPFSSTNIRTGLSFKSSQLSPTQCVCVMRMLATHGLIRLFQVVC